MLRTLTIQNEFFVWKILGIWLYNIENFIRKSKYFDDILLKYDLVWLIPKALYSTRTLSIVKFICIFWEGHKVLRNLHQRFLLCRNGQIYDGDFTKFCGLLRMYELYKTTYFFFKVRSNSSPACCDCHLACAKCGISRNIVHYV